MSEWVATDLISVTEKIGSGATPKGGKEEYKSEGISLIRSQNVLDFNFSTDGLAFIDNDQADKLKNVIIEENDVLINITGDSVARVCSAPKEYLPARVNQHVALLRPKEKELNSNFLKYFLLAPRQKNQLLMLASSGATRNALTKGMLENFDINLPPLPEQKAIAKILGDLDNKIELNRQMNNTLEQMAQALFQSWFVDFDPVIDNVLAAGNEIPELLQSKAEKRKAVPTDKKLINTNHGLAKLFPSTFTYSETLGKWIPDGWNLEPIGEHLYIKGRIGWKGLKRSEYSSEETGFRIINGSDFQDEQINSKSCGWITQERYDESPEIQLQENDILITKDGTIGKLAFVYNLDTKSSVASGVFVVRTESDKLSTMFCWSFFKSNLFQQVVKTKIDGSVIPHLYQRDFVEMFIPIPSTEILNQFETQASGIFTKIFKNKLEIETLSQLRDTLLPQLISGKLRLPEAMLN